jgi:hypothetical protein
MKIGRFTARYDRFRWPSRCLRFSGGTESTVALLIVLATILHKSGVSKIDQPAIRRGEDTARIPLPVFGYEITQRASS